MNAETANLANISLIDVLFCYIIWTFRKIINIFIIDENELRIRSSMVAGCVYGFLILMIILWMDFVFFVKLLKSIWLYECIVVFPFAVVVFVKFEKHAMKYYNCSCRVFERINTTVKIMLDSLIVIFSIVLPVLLALSGKYICAHL